MDRITTTGAQRAFVFIFAFLIIGMMITTVVVPFNPLRSERIEMIKPRKYDPESPKKIVAG
jgi:hypothetical protein